MSDISEKFLRDEGLAKYSSYRFGGPADWFFEASGSDEVLEAVKWAEENGVKIFVIGGGSNLLFDDEGFRGLVVRVKDGEVKVDGERVLVDAGVPMAKLVRFAGENGLGGIEAWAGLPGTVGGAVFGNAGCFGVEVKDVLESAEVFVPGEGVVKFGVDDFGFDYRDSSLKRERKGVVLSVVFRLKKGDVEEIKANMAKVMKKRREKQPAGASAGSFFKNPVDHPAGWLIDQCGLKGERVGGAEISEEHGNFILNKKGAKASDILALAEMAEAAVKEKFGIELERELVYVAP